MDPGPLRHPAAARSANREHLTYGAFILEGVVINLAVITRDQQIYPITRELENVTSDPAMAGSSLRLHCSNGVGQPEASNGYERGGAAHDEAGGASDLGAADRVRRDHDRMLGRPLPVNIDGPG